MRIRDFITIVEVSDGEQGSSGPAYRNRGTWIYNDDPNYYQWGEEGQRHIDMVGYNGSLYASKRSGSAQTPPAKVPISNIYWDIIIAKGYIDSDLEWNYVNTFSPIETSLIKVGGEDGVADANATSVDKYRGNCFISFNIADNTSTLSAGISSSSKVLYGFSFAQGQVSYLENGILGKSVSYKATDQFAIDYSNNVVEYYVNGSVVHSIQEVKLTDPLGFCAVISTITSYPVITDIKLSTFEPYIDWVRDWENGKTYIGDTYLVAPKAFLGMNNGTTEAPELTGVAIGVDINGTFSSEVGIAGYNINQQTFIIKADGSAVFGVDSSESSQFEIKPDGSASIKNLNADNITAGTILGSMIDAKGIVVRDETEKESFIITETGDVDIRGEIKSMDYVADDKTGFALLRDGKAVLNEAIVRGSVILPNAGITNSDIEEDSVRIWAGADYENRYEANFRITQGGDLYAKKGTFGGLVAAQEIHTGTLHMVNGEFTINNIETSLDDTGTSTINTRNGETEEVYIKLQKDSSIINSDLSIGEGRFKITNSTDSLDINDTTVSIVGTDMDLIFDKDENLTISSLIEGQNTSLSIGYSKSESWVNTLIIENKGAKSSSEYGDICLKRENSRDNIDFGVLGNITVQGSISSFEHGVEMRSVPNEGWGFYII